MKRFPIVLACIVLSFAVFFLGCEPKPAVKETPEPAKAVVSDNTQTAAPAAKPAEPAAAEAKVEPKAAEQPAPTPAPAPAAAPAAAAKPEVKPAEPNVPAPVAEVDPNSTAVTVNGMVITEGEVLAKIKPQLDKAAGQVPPEYLEKIKGQMKQQALQGMIVEKLLDAKVKEANVVVTDEDAIAHLTKMGSQQQPPLSIDEIKTLIEAQGQSFDTAKQQIRKGLGYQKVVEAQMTDKSDVNEADAKKYYTENAKQFENPEQIKASHILIKFDADPNKPGTDPNQAKAEAKAKAEDILKKIKDGADFATLAKENSSCPSAPKGGDLGFFSKGKMVPAFEEAAFALNVGQVSDVVETQFGYHIIKVTEHKDANTVPFEQAKDNIIKMLTQKKQGDFAKAYIEKIKSEAKIVYPAGKEPPPAPVNQMGGMKPQDQQ